jgi:uncharacterized membrane protein (Fun14 family)
MDLQVPAKGTEIGIATILGGCTGFAAKKMTKGVAITLGLGFMGLQALAHANLIQVNWPRVENLVISRLDTDKDGKLTTKDLQVTASRIVSNLGNDLPSSAGFVAAFWIGFRYG